MSDRDRRPEAIADNPKIDSPEVAKSNVELGNVGWAPTNGER